MQNQKKVATTLQIKTATELYKKFDGVIEQTVKALIAKGWTDGDISRAVTVPHFEKTGRTVIPQWPNNIRKRVAKK